MRENSSVRVILQRLIRNRSALAGCLMFLLIVILALIGTRFTPYDPVQIDIKYMNGITNPVEINEIKNMDN